MKKFILFICLILAGSMAFGQNSIFKLKTTKLLTSSYTTAGSDSVIYTLQAEWDWSIQIRARYGTSCDSIYTSVKIYISNSDPDAVWSIISDINDTYTASSDTLTNTNALVNNAWLTYSSIPFQHSRIKIVLLCLDNTNEDNYYDIYFLAKPDFVWSRQDK
jgi:hypothetical protein